MPFCLTPQATELLKKKIAEDKLTAEDFHNMDDAERHGYFASFLDDATATKLNEMIESKLLLKDQQRGIVNGLKEAFGEKHPAYRDAVAKVMRMERILKPSDVNKFMSDLAAHKLGKTVTADQAARLHDLAKSASDSRDVIPKDSPNGSKERLDYGSKLAAFKKYVSDLKNPSEGIKDYLSITKLAGVSKSLVANLNNHFFGRQGWRTLFDRPDVWMNNFAKSWGDMAKELKGQDAMNAVRADVWSRENAINGLYRIHKVDIGLDSEEAFPEHLPGKIPLLGRLYKASESAFNGASLRMRADTFDALVKEAKAQGVDVNDPNTNLGKLANSITARGDVNLGQLAKPINVMMFSPKYLKSQLDALAAVPDYTINKIGLGGGTEAAEFSRAKAAQNVLKLIAGVGTILTISKLIDPESVEQDPRSKKFGKVWVGPSHEVGIDVTAGMGSLITIASRLIPTEHNGKWAMWYETSKGKYINIGKSRNIHPADLVFDFMEQRSSPLANYILTSYLDHKLYDKETAIQKAEKLVQPMQAETMHSLAHAKEPIDAFLYSLLSAASFLGVHETVKSK